MLYTAAELSGHNDTGPNRVQKSHAEILKQFTEHLSEEELAYFKKWDSLIDMEADATQSSVTEAWLEKSEDRERATSKSISSLVYEMCEVDEGVSFIWLRRSDNSALQTPLSNFHHLNSGSYVSCC